MNYPIYQLKQIQYRKLRLSLMTHVTKMQEKQELAMINFSDLM